MRSSNCAVCGSKKTRFIKQQEGNGIIDSLAKSSSNIPFVDPLLFQRHKMNEIIKTFLSKFLSEMHLTQTRFTYSSCGPFAKSKERIKKIKGNEDSKYLYQNEQDEACFQSYRPY